MEFNHLPSLMEEAHEDVGIELENIIEIETMFGKHLEMLPEELNDHYILHDDYLQKELERQEQEGINSIYQNRIP